MGRTYAIKGGDAIGEELEVVRGARGLVGEASLSAAAIVAREVDARRSLSRTGDVGQRDLEDTVPIRAEAEFQLAVLDKQVGVDF